MTCLGRDSERLQSTQAARWPALDGASGCPEPDSLGLNPLSEPLPLALEILREVHQGRVVAYRVVEHPQVSQRRISTQLNGSSRLDLRREPENPAKESVVPSACVTGLSQDRLAVGRGQYAVERAIVETRLKVGQRRRDSADKPQIDPELSAHRLEFEVEIPEHGLASALFRPFEGCERSNKRAAARPPYIEFELAGLAIDEHRKRLCCDFDDEYSTAGRNLDRLNSLSDALGQVSHVAIEPGGARLPENVDEGIRVVGSSYQLLLGADPEEQLPAVSIGKGGDGNPRLKISSLRQGRLELSLPAFISEVAEVSHERSFDSLCLLAGNPPPEGLPADHYLVTGTGGIA